MESFYEKALDASYRTAYSLLSMLPEDKAISYGQYFLKVLPIEKLIPQSTPNDTGVKIGGVSLRSPVILASYYKDPEIWEKTFALGFGAVTTKTVTVKERPYRKKSVARLGNGFVNCEAFPNYGKEKTIGNLVKFRGKYSGDGKLIVSVGAVEGINEYMELASDLEPYADFIEINASSPNTDLAYSMAKSPCCVERVSSEIASRCTVPLIWKVSPDFMYENITRVIPTLIKNSVSIVNWSNTRKIKDPRLVAGEGGESGPGLYSNMIRNIGILRKEFGNDISIIGCGGIDSENKACDVLNYADAVALLSGFVRDIGLPRRINNRLAEKVGKKLKHTDARSASFSGNFEV